MTAQPTLQTIQRRDLRLVTTRERNPVRIVVLPVPAPNPRRDWPAPQDNLADDLNQATWEDAEWR